MCELGALVFVFNIDNLEFWNHTLCYFKYFFYKQVLNTDLHSV